jgi:hypothetical protein
VVRALAGALGSDEWHPAPTTTATTTTVAQSQPAVVPPCRLTPRPTPLRYFDSCRQNAGTAVSV